MKTMILKNSRKMVVLSLISLIFANFAMADQKDKKIPEEAIYQVVEKKLQLEDWMFNTSYLAYHKSESCREHSLDLESWMFDTLTTSELELPLENWMFKNYKISETEQKLESWMFEVSKSTEQKPDLATNCK